MATFSIAAWCVHLKQGWCHDCVVRLLHQRDGAHAADTAGAAKRLAAFAARLRRAVAAVAAVGKLLPAEEASPAKRKAPPWTTTTP
jgi:hypothetical protein